jgi:hypothetical protein
MSTHTRRQSLFENTISVSTFEKGLLESYISLHSDCSSYYIQKCQKSCLMDRCNSLSHRKAATKLRASQ